MGDRCIDSLRRESLRSSLWREAYRIERCLRGGADMATEHCAPLVDRIRSAFAGASLPDEENLVIATTDDEGTADFFSRKRRDDVPYDDLVKHYVALWYFTDQAFLYYLPAFMIAALCVADWRNVIWGHIYAQFSGQGRRDSVILALSDEQRSCLVEFFRNFDDNTNEIVNLLYPSLPSSEGEIKRTEKP
jgi:hypothetical protein